MKLKSIAIAVLALSALTSCSKKTVLPYFVDIADVAEGTVPTQAYDLTIRPDDELFITVTSSQPAAAEQYNLPAANPATRAELNINTQPRQQTYIVNSRGDILMPTIGSVHVAGLTVEEVQQKLTEIVSRDIADAVVRVELVNFQVNVGGEVTKPGTVSVKRNRFSVLDALSACGDLTPYGNRHNVLVIREENGQRQYARINLNSSEALTSPYFYLKQNDYIYVEPNDVRQANATYNQDNAFKLQVVSTLVSATSVIASLMITLFLRRN